METFGQALPLELRVKLGLYRLRQDSDARIEAFGHFEWLEPDDLGEGAPIYCHKELFLAAAKALKDAKGAPGGATLLRGADGGGGIL